MTDISLYLKNNGPTLSGELIRLIRNEEGISDVAIRQRLSRQIDPICSLKGIFAENQTLFYLKEQYRQPEYYEGILKALSIAAKRHYAVITALRYHQGFIPAEYIASYTFSTVENLRGHKRIDDILNDLVKWELIRLEGNYITTTSNADLNIGSKFSYSKCISQDLI